MGRPLLSKLRTIPEYIVWIGISIISVLLIVGSFIYASTLQRDQQLLPQNFQQNWQEIVPVAGTFLNAIYQSDSNKAMTLLSPNIPAEHKVQFRRWVNMNPLSGTKEVKFSPIVDETNGWMWSKVVFSPIKVSMELAFIKENGVWVVIYLKLM